MKFPYCSHPESRVIDKRTSDDLTVARRRRERQKWSKRFTTYERIEQIQLKVEKKDGRVEDYEREKIKKGIFRAIEKRPVTEEQVEALIDDIEEKLLNRKSTQISTSDIGRMVLTRLKKLDKVAYLRFASVFLEFDNIGEFKEEINKLWYLPKWKPRWKQN